MGFRSYQPTGLLSPLVSSIWIYEGQPGHSAERIIPNACRQLLVNLEADEMSWWDGADFNQAHRLSGAALSGAFARPFAIDTKDQRSISGVTFRPGGANAFFDVSMHELSHDHFNLADLACPDLRDALLEARQHGLDAVLQTWVQFLSRRWRRTPQRRVLAACARLEMNNSVQGVADALGVSVRTVRNDVRDATGLSPKDFARVRRLQRVLRGIAQGPEGPVNWSARAFEGGYADQSHLIHEFHSLTGLTPTEYTARSPDDWNHVVLPGLQH